MAVYLGATQLDGGGGGGTPIGGFAFFENPPGVSFTSGKEVYTDADNIVWIKTAATILSSDSGVLEASQYSGSTNSLLVTSNTFSGGGGYVGRTCFGYNGVHLQAIGLRGGNNYGSYALRDEDNTDIATSYATTGPFSAGYSQDPGGTTNAMGWVFGSSFYNDTHAFTGFHRPGINSFYSAAKHAYTPFTSFTGSTNGYSQTNYFTLPVELMATTNIQTTPRYWGVSQDGTTVTEYTFNASASNGTNPFTAVSPSNTFTVASAERFMSDGVDKLYVHSGTSLYQYDLNGNNTLTFSGLPAAITDTSYHVGFVCVPAFKNSDNVTQFWTRTGGSTANNSAYQTFTRYDLVETVEGPFTGSSASKGLIHLQDVDSNDILGQGGNLIYLWKRIA
tara:strand:- start:12866 stop:14038 length:1173 start_codon:yes stop_codon:yes gene_type:complete